jgi:hypothetical protein
MKKTVLWNIFKSKYCLAVFILGMLLGYLLVPKKIFYGAYFIIGIIYILVFAIMVVCIVRNIKDKVTSLKNTGSSILSIIASVIGLGAMQICGIGAPLCSAGIGLSIFSIIVPSASITVLSKYSTIIILASIILQVTTLYYMGCFKKCIKNISRS